MPVTSGAEQLNATATMQSSGSQSSSGDLTEANSLGESRNRRSLLAQQLKLLALALFLLFITLVVNALVPPSLLNPAWLMRLASVLISNAFLPLIGLALLNQAAVFYPNKKLEDFSKSLAQWAVLATLGFLLLLPLQIYASWRLIREDFSSLERGRPSIEDPLLAMERAIRTAPDANTIQTKLTVLRGPAITPQDMARPLPELKQMLLDSLQEARASLRRKAEREGTDPRTWVLIQDVIRFSIASIGFAAAFAGFAQRKDAKISLLQEVVSQARFQQILKRNAGKKSKRSRSRRSSSRN